MKVLFDTNIVLDIMLDRKPFADVATQLLSKVETGELQGFLCATTITTIHYLAARVVGQDQAKLEIEKLLTLFEIAPVNHIVLMTAIKLNIADFEDAVIHEAARHVGVQAIVTRDLKGFQDVSIPVYLPQKFIEVYHSIEKDTPKEGLS